MKIGILSLQGDVDKHLEATKKARENLGIECEILLVKTIDELDKVDGLIIPGGESTTLMKLLDKGGVVPKIKEIKNIFGTCAGAILLSKSHLNLMDFEIERNAYGSQLESFEENISTNFGEIRGVFIRAPKIKNIGNNVKVIANKGNGFFGIEEKKENKFYIALTFHPELTTTKFHEYFLRNIIL